MKTAKQTQAELLSELMDNFKRVNPFPADVDGAVKPRFDLDAMKRCISEEADFIDAVNKYNAKMQDIVCGIHDNAIKELNKEYKKVLFFTDADEFGFKQISDDSDTFALSYIMPLDKNCNDDIEINVFYTTTYVSIILDNGKEVGLRAIVGISYSTDDHCAINPNTFYAESFDALIQNDIKLQQSLVRIIKNQNI